MGLFGPKQRWKVNITSREVSERVVPESGQTGACSADRTEQSRNIFYLHIMEVRLGPAYSGFTGCGLSLRICCVIQGKKFHRKNYLPETDGSS